MWIDTQGRTIEAEFVKSSVSIRRADGQVLDIPLASLSTAERDYVTGQSVPTSARVKIPSRRSTPS